ncbi:MAG: tetratricopeptide repeat protein [Paracoccus sp. (in: a-proteobacteria)]|uniref:tetratricopeptide repeat protein n=1 Tax=Paracoccus sp. TaxID=267 RepID=UPI0026DFEE3B|nr:tetratricopeptide repeat protein [Paracoccus sp. (in: a-proteobacteria)]MDO5613440.1 tetratricopeptide repeat protein [Paracoccus sp. (in: a-proteobacteria)]
MRPTRLVLALTAVLALGACESSKDKAERYYQSAMTLLEAGDIDRATVELRNVFRYDGAHYAARKQLADLLIQRGNAREGYSQLLRLAEQYPQDAAVRRQLADMAITLGNWDEAERHGREAERLEPGNPELDTILLALDYRKAALARDTAAQADVIQRARTQLTDDPGNVMLLRLLASYYVENQQQADALEMADALIAAEPDSIEPAMLKLGLLGREDDDAATEAHLNWMIGHFPGDTQVMATQAAWYVAKNRLDDAEQIWRHMADQAEDGSDASMGLIQFMERYHGSEAALAETERLSQAAQDDAGRQIYDSMRAYYMFNLGQRDASIELLRSTLNNAQPSAQTNRLRAMLAGMLLNQGQTEEADRLVQEVLDADSTNIFALRVKAESLMNNGRANEAIIELRRALDQAPRDLDTLNLLATAYERAGNRQLMGETLASAVDISAAAPETSVRYAAFLIQDNRRAAARTVIDDALRNTPSDTALLTTAGRMAVEDQAWGRVTEIAAQLEAVQNNAAAQAAASALRSEAMLRQGRVDEGLALLQQRADEGQGNRAAVLSLIRARVMAGQHAEARGYLDGLLAETPDDAELQLINSGLLLSEGKLAEAEQVLRDVIAANPQAPGPVQLLYGQLVAQERADDANAVLTDALSRMPDDARLNMIHASVLERDGQIDGALAIYEKLYAANPADTVLANNVASLLATWRRDPESLARATAAAQRLRGTTVPPFQDTYGWIAYLNNNAEEGLPYLERAVQGLPEDPLVRFHLGMTQARLGQNEAARASLTTALELAGDQELPQMAEAREMLATLDGTADGQAAPAGQ